MKKRSKRFRLNRETLQHLDPLSVRRIVAAAAPSVDGEVCEDNDDLPPTFGLCGTIETGPILCSSMVPPPDTQGLCALH